MYNGRHLPSGGSLGHSGRTLPYKFDYDYDNNKHGSDNKLKASPLPSPSPSPTPSFTGNNYSASTTAAAGNKPRRSTLRIRMVQSTPFVRDSLGRHANGDSNGSGLLPTSAKDAHFKGKDVAYGYGYGCRYEDEDAEDARHMQTKHPQERRALDVLAFIAGSVSMMFSAAYTAYLILSSNPRSLGWFAYHPPLQMLALCFLTISILIPQPATQPKSRFAALLAHQLIVLLLGVPALLGGASAIYHAKTVEARAHFRSRHAKLGLAALVLVCAHVLVGMGITWFRGALCGSGGARAKRLWRFHRLAGYLIYPFLLYVGHIGGAKSTFTTSHASSAMRLICYTIAPVIALISIYSRVRLPKLPFFSFSDFSRH